ncbi:hypothetical protein N7488_002671 [Penicillium malachiteum]|nr:hypothetical protein N7488_002671 [Penicillium malachiteum]
MKLHHLIACSRPSTLSKLFIARKVTRGLGGVRYKSITKEWKGASTEDHNTCRSQKGDTHDPASSAAATGINERKANEGIADKTKSSGITQRGGVEHGRKAKQEHPAAPEPIIGMNDERAQKGH